MCIRDRYSSPYCSAKSVAPFPTVSVRYRAVSYTHLDVYKRQVQFSLSLPETWDYEIRNLTFAGTTTTDAIIFWNIAYPEDTFTLIYACLLYTSRCV